MDHHAKYAPTRSCDGHAFATPFAVEGRSTREVIAEFGDNDAWQPAPASRHQMRLEARVHPGEAWIAVVAFTWWAPPSGAATADYLAYRNEATAE